VRPLAGAERVEWRLLWSGAADGRTNMAVDLALLEGCAAGTAPPTVRFYTWDPPTVSLGYAQDPEAELDLTACQRLGVAWVRRPTGGRAVLHGRDLSYSVAAPAELLPGGVLEVYRRLGEGLADGLRRLGVPAALVARAARGPGGAASGACFLAASWWEVAVRGRKLVGSAQARRRGAVLQHGAVALEEDADRLAAVLRVREEGERERLRLALRRSGTSLATVLGGAPAARAVAAALAAGLAGALGARLVPGELTSEELRRVEELRRSGGAGRRSPGGGE